jgi:alanyl-tRNA synthetase
LAVDRARRAKIMSNHTTTHVMNRALRDLVNPEAMQKGSLVDDQKLRFDFSHKAALTEEELAKVEQQVNDDITRDLPVYIEHVPQDKALKINGLRAVFGEKYPPVVRVVSIGVPVKDLIAKPNNKEWAGYSIEFCGGTHLAKTGDAEGFCIVSQDAVSKGVRRITALTGSEAHKATAEGDRLVHRAESLLSAPADTLAEQIEAITKAADAAQLPVVARGRLRELLTALSQKVKQFQKEQGGQAEEAVVESARAIAEAASGPVIVSQVPGADGKTLRTAMDVVRKKHPESAIFLAAEADGKVALMATATKANIDNGLKAGDWIKHVAPVVGGGGGGRPDSAQAGGKDPAKLPEALEAAKVFAADALG